jgi:hypothetical protein
MWQLREQVASQRHLCSSSSSSRNVPSSDSSSSGQLGRVISYKQQHAGATAMMVSTDAAIAAATAAISQHCCKCCHRCCCCCRQAEQLPSGGAACISIHDISQQPQAKQRPTYNQNRTVTPTCHCQVSIYRLLRLLQQQIALPDAAADWKTGSQQQLSSHGCATETSHLCKQMTYAVCCTLVQYHGVISWTVVFDEAIVDARR